VTSDDREVITQTLDALERLMRMFQVERIVYLLLSVISFGLMVIAGYLMLKDQHPSYGQFSLIFGSSGLCAASVSRVARFLNKSFNLIEDVVRKLTGVGPRSDS
jgi:flagellar biosynthesis protein FlhB